MTAFAASRTRMEISAADGARHRGRSGTEGPALESLPGVRWRVLRGRAQPRCGRLGVENPGGQSGELVDLIRAEMREEPPFQSGDVVVLSLLELLDPLVSDRDYDAATVVAGRCPGDQSPRLEFGHQP